MRVWIGGLGLTLLMGACSGDQDAGTSPAERSETPPSAQTQTRLEAARTLFVGKIAGKGGLLDPASKSSAAQFGTSRTPLTTADHRERALERALPQSADAPSWIRDVDSGVAVGFKLVGASATQREIVDGLVVSARVFPGADAFARLTPDGLEDFVLLETAPDADELRYELSLERVAGLRQIGAVLEFLDSHGAPRLRVQAPGALDASQQEHRLTLSVRGCAVDHDPRGPWGRDPLPPGNDSCELAVQWDGDAVRYPLLVDPAWTATANMTYPRTHHGAGLLPSGKALIGGGTQSEPALSSEIWDPGTGTWALSGTFNVARNGSPVFVRLPNDKLLVAGTSHTALTGETYDEQTGTWTPTGNLVSPRGEVRPTLLNSGKVLLAGGFYPTAHANAETYDSTTDQWSDAGTLAEGRYANAVVKLSNGRVLIAGGYKLQATNATATAEVYNPFLNTWTQVKSMNHARAEFEAILLPSGKVLVAGGRDDTQVPALQNSAEIYDPVADTWTDVGNLANRVTSYRFGLMDDGSVAIFGGWISGPTTNAVQFFTESGGWVSTSPMIWPRDSHTATRLTDGRWLIAGGGNILNTAEVYGIVAQGGTCTLDNECATNHCVDGYCCDTACTGSCSSCSAAKKGSGANGVCGAIAAQTDPDKECGSCSTCSGSGACGPVTAGTDPKNNCKDSGSPTCGLDGTCDGAGACRSYTTNAGCSPRACTLGSECESGFCADGVCCDQACNGECMSCLAAKKGTGVDGQCGPIAADSDPDDECAEGPNFPTSCLADGQCDGQGACRQFAKQTVACGQTQCTGNSAVGLLCNGAGTCGQAVAYCDPYLCDQGACLSTCQTNNDCTADAFCTTLNTCEKKLTNGSACGAGHECVSNFCVDGVCCDSACNGQCEACNVEPNLGACVPVNGAPVGSRTQCVTSDADCAGTCDGVDRAACSYPGSEIRCGTPSCESGIAHSSFCNAKGACVPDDDLPCGAYACADTKCKTTCAVASDCAAGYTCSDQGTCVPGATCSDDLTTSNGVSGERTCAPFLCDPGSGNCLQLCSTSSECVSGFVCDTAIKACIAANGAGVSSEDSGCGCKVPGTPTPSSGRWLVFGVGVVLLRRRRKLRTSARSN